MTPRILLPLVGVLRQRNVTLMFAGLTALFPLSGCVGVSRVATLPPDAGVVARYYASIDKVEYVVPEALNAVGQSEVERSRPDSSSIVMLGRRGASLFDYGEVSRTFASTTPQGGSVVRVVMAPRYIFDVWPSTSRTLRAIAEIDRLLGPDEIVLGAGDHVRGIGAAGERVEGILMVNEAGRLTLSPHRGDRPGVPLDALLALEIQRGSYGRTKAGFLIGVGLGHAVLVAALVSFVRSAGSAPCLDPDPPISCHFPIQAVVIAAPALGALIGSAFRTSVWSRAASPR